MITVITMINIIAVMALISVITMAGIRKEVSNRITNNTTKNQ